MPDESKPLQPNDQTQQDPRVQTETTVPLPPYIVDMNFNVKNGIPKDFQYKSKNKKTQDSKQ